MPRTPDDFRRYVDRLTKPKKWRGQHLDGEGRPKKKDPGDRK